MADGVSAQGAISITLLPWKKENIARTVRKGME